MDILKFFNSKKKPEAVAKPKPKVNVFASGSSGTEIYAGYLFEEYLAELRGSDWADKVDMMRRSDPIIKMITRALSLPLLSQNWFIEMKEETPEAEWQKKLFEKVIFEDMTDSFTKTLGEIVTFYAFGYSLFEKVHGVSYDEELGLYNTIKRFAFRSQRTIESWKISKTGNLESVYQQAQGDVGKNIHMNAKFLVHFAPEMEGDNYEGVSVLRPCYGPWLRKNEFLKLIAAGIEKYAIPTPILKVPADKITGPEFDNAIEALECYTSNQSQYLTFPEGWELTVNNVTFDAEKVRKIIDSENAEMVNSVLASFLLLGQNGGGGSYSLSNDLSDFFAQTLQAAADHISEVIEKKVMQDVLNLNRPGQKLLCTLRCDSLRDRADTEFATTMKLFLDAGILSKDPAIEAFIREKYKYPKKEELEVEEQEEAQVLSFAEKKSPKRVKAQILIDELADTLKEFFKGAVLIMSGDFIHSMDKALASSRNVFQASLKLDDPSTNIHAKIVEYLTMRYALEAKKDIAAKSKIKLSETFELSDSKIDKLLLEFSDLSDQLQKNPLNRQLLLKIKEVEKKILTLAGSEVSKLSKALTQTDRDKLKARARVLVDTQASDVYKGLNLTAQQNADMDINALRFEVGEKARAISAGPVVITGPDILASTTVNSIRDDFAFEKESGIQTATFVAEMDDRTSKICEALNEMTISIDDPRLAEFQPPLHHNALVEGSMVETIDGLKAIEDVNVGDMVKTHTGEFHRVYNHMKKFEYKDYLVIELESGKTLKATEEHPILTKRGWVRAGDLGMCDDIVCVEDI